MDNVHGNERILAWGIKLFKEKATKKSCPQNARTNIIVK